MENGSTSIDTFRDWLSERVSGMKRIWSWIAPAGVDYYFGMELSLLEDNKKAKKVKTPFIASAW